MADRVPIKASPTKIVFTAEADGKILMQSQSNDCNTRVLASQYLEVAWVDGMVQVTVREKSIEGSKEEV